MTAQPNETARSAAWAAAKPTISILIPYFRDDPTALVRALDQQDGAWAVEIVTQDDGSNNEALGRRVDAAVRGAKAAALSLRSRANLGRARGRNRLAEQARGDWLLFLDADMAPDAPEFIANYLDVVATDAPAVAFGGFSLAQAPRTRDLALHRRMAEASDCLSAEARRQEPEKHVFTSNLLVRRDVFAANTFDEGFAGWGWEDVEWAVRVARDHPITHIDNTATHLGLDPAATLAAKYEQSAGNFARLAAEHRDIVARYPSYRAAQLLKRVPFRGAWRPALKAYALAEAAPLGSRALAMRLYRAALYAEATA